MLEAMYGAQESKLETSLVDYDQCSNLGNYFTLDSKSNAKKLKADECDRIAKVQKCGVDKDPELVSNMLQVAEISTPVVRN